jgi:hypothetical protein
MKKAILILFGLLFCSEVVFSQGFYNKNSSRNLILSVGTGTTHYYGDLAKSGDHSNIKPNFDLGVRYNIYRWFSAGAQLTWFMLSGDDKSDPGKEIRNLSFQSHNIEFSGVIQVSVFEESGKFYMRQIANPFIYGGIGLVSYNPTAKLEGERYNLKKLNTSGEDYSGITACFPVGGGVKFRLNSFLNIVADGGYRFLLSDNIDDVSSGIYPEPTSFTDPTARLLSDRTWETLPPGTPTWAEQGTAVRGNPDNNDGYFIFNVKLEYYFAQIGKGQSSGFGIKKRKSKNSNKIKPPKRRSNSYINKKRRF